MSSLVIVAQRFINISFQATVVSSKTSLDKGILHHKFLTSHIWKGEQYPPQLHDSLLKLLGMVGAKARNWLTEC